MLNSRASHIASLIVMGQIRGAGSKFFDEPIDDVVVLGEMGVKISILVT
jgi:hypothetical protein